VFKFTFTTPGIYTYFDETLGAQMQGTITVQ
jgi:plastocyanin